MSKGIRYSLKLLLFLLLLSPFLYTWVESFYESQASAIQTINVHEHIESRKQLPKLLEIMKQTGMEKVVLLGSPRAAILGTEKGFEGYEKNNQEVLKMAQDQPDKFIAFPTVDIEDPDKLARFQTYREQGAQGLKLYSGHKEFHTKPLDDASMLPLYRYCENENIPILFHVNAGYYQEELERVLSLYPKLNVICPHYCLSSIALDRLEHLMSHYPNLYVDTSFGFIEFLKQGLTRFSKHSGKYKTFVQKYQDRILFGTDVVISSEPFKSAIWLSQAAKSYRDMLEKEHYTFFQYPDETLRGLHLSTRVLKKIYRHNFERLLAD